MTLLSITARRFAIKNAARRISKEVQGAGIDTLVELADAGISIVATFLNGSSPQKQVEYRSEIGVLLKMGISIEEVLDEISRQNPKLSSIIQKQAYKQEELRKIQEFLKGG